MKALSTLLLFSILIFNTANAAMTFKSPNLSPSLNEYDAAQLTDENGTQIPMVAIVYPDANGASGIAAAKFQKQSTSQVTGRRGMPLYKAAGGKFIPTMALVKMDTSTNLPVPFVPQDSAKLVAINCNVSVGGAASEALTCTGLLTTDTILAVSQSVKGANGTAINAYNTLITNGLTVSWTADPGAGAVIKVLVKHL